MQSYRILHCLLAILAMVSCTSQRQLQSPDYVFKKQIEEKLGEKFSCVNNDTDEFVLCFASETKESVKYVSFALYEATSNLLIYEQSHVRGVKWNSSFELRIDSFTRISIGESPENYYLYDAKKRKRVIN